MTEKPSRKPDDAEQSARFIDTARKIEAEEDDAAFDKAFRRVVPLPIAHPKQGDD